MRDRVGVVDLQRVAHRLHGLGQGVAQSVVVQRLAQVRIQSHLLRLSLVAHDVLDTLTILHSHFFGGARPLLRLE